MAETIQTKVNLAYDIANRLSASVSGATFSPLDNAPVTYSSTYSINELITSINGLSEAVTNFAHKADIEKENLRNIVYVFEEANSKMKRTINGGSR